MKTFFLSFAGALLAIVVSFLLLIFFMIASIGAAMAGGGNNQPTHPVVLALNLNYEYADQRPLGGFAALNEEPGFIDLLTRIKAGETDARVKGIYLRASDFGVGSSRAEELRQALTEFRKTGKFVVAHTQGSFGVGGPSTISAITAADEIWIQPGTDVFSAGVTFETEFLKGMFEKIDVKSEIYPFYEFKNAPNSYNETAYTAPHREAMLALAQSVWDNSLAAMAEDRKLDVAALKATLESGPQTSEQLVKMKLMDKEGYPEEAEDSAIERAGENAELLDISMYVAPPVKGKDNLIAVVGGEGGVVTGGSESGSPFGDAPGFASDTVARAILDAGEDEDVKAIVFRVDSPGGSPIASDQIWHAIEHVQTKGKPVVVSMGSLAASGGYYVSAGADHIVANKSTITGSIGIFGGKFAIEGGLNKLGVTLDRVSVGGEMADAYGADAFTQAQEAEVKASLKRGYDRFLGIVGEGRKMTYDQVHEVARGRVWSGNDAVGKGLVDSLGGFMDAVDKAKELGGIPADTQARLAYYPARKSGFEALEGFFGVSSETARAAAVLSAVAGHARTAEILEDMQMIEAVNRGEVVARAPRMRER
jgi:protease IV